MITTELQVQQCNYEITLKMHLNIHLIKNVTIIHVHVIAINMQLRFQKHYFQFTFKGAIGLCMTSQLVGGASSHVPFHVEFV